MQGAKGAGPQGHRPPFDSTTGKGYISHKDGDYTDALMRGSQVIVFLVETFGGICPEAIAFLRTLAEQAGKKGHRDGTNYDGWTNDFLSHHKQTIASAAVIGNAEMFIEAINKNICGAIRTGSASSYKSTSRQLSQEYTYADQGVEHER